MASVPKERRRERDCGLRRSACRWTCLPSHDDDDRRRTVRRRRRQRVVGRDQHESCARARSVLGYLRRVEELGVFVALAVMVGVVGAFHPQFLAIDSVTNLLQQASYYGIIALGMVFMLSLREVDLSVGSNMGFSAILCALLVAHGINPWLGSLIALAAGAALGVFNAVVANTFRLPLIIVTLGTLSMYQGLELVVANGNIVSGGNVRSSFFRVLGGSVDQIPASARSCLPG